MTQMSWGEGELLSLPQTASAKALRQKHTWGQLWLERREFRGDQWETRWEVQQRPEPTEPLYWMGSTLTPVLIPPPKVQRHNRIEACLCSHPSLTWARLIFVVISGSYRPQSIAWGLLPLAGNGRKEIVQISLEILSPRPGQVRHHLCLLSSGQS